MSPAFSKSNSTFIDWNTSSDGLGVSFTDAATYSFANDASLFAQWAPIPSVSILFFNGGGAGSIASISAPVGSSVVLPSGIGLSRTGYTFSGWNASAGGNGIAYSVGQTYVLNANVALYAQWTPDVFVVDFTVSNGAMPQAPATFTYGLAPLILPTLSLTGYSFAGWFNVPIGGNLVGFGGQSFTPSGSTVIYSQWTPEVFTVNYSLGSGVAPQPPATFTFGSAPLTLPTPALPGYSLAGWFSAVSGGSLIGTGGSSFSPTASTMLYARWTPDVFVVSFVGDGGAVPAASVDFSVGTTPLVLETPTLSGNEFLGWYDAASGGVLIGGAGTIFTPTTSTALYAHWSPVAPATLSFNPNGGSGSVAPISGVAGMSVTVPGSTGMLRAGFTLARWNTAANGRGVAYLPGQSVVLASDLVLFAQWSGHAPAVLYGAVGIFALNSAHLSSPLVAEVNRLAASIVAKKYSVIDLYGYTAATGLGSLNASLSRARAQSVARYLRLRLHTLHARQVLIKISGEGAVSGETSATYSRVEVFVS